MQNFRKIVLGLALTLSSHTLFASSTGTSARAITVQMSAVDASGVNAVLGSILISESKYGLVFTPMLKGLASGLHGFHLHEFPSCGAGQKEGVPAAAMGAGGHYDPESSKKHSTPWGDGHRGDLPPLYVDAQGLAQNAVLAPRLKMRDLNGRSLMLHAGADNYSDLPQALGGGGARVACGVISAVALNPKN